MKKNINSLLQWCKKRGLKYSSIHLRVCYKGMTREEAVKDYLNKKAEIEKYGRYAHSVRNTYKGQALYRYCVDRGISYATIARRISKGMTIEQALNHKRYGRILNAG